MRARIKSLVVLCLVGCSTESTGPVAIPIDPSAAISDAVHSAGTDGFYFLPPIVSNPGVAGTFDVDVAVLDPKVFICDLSLGTEVDCGGSTPADVEFSSTSTPAITVDGAAEQYQVNWDTSAQAAGHTYRVHVWAGSPGARRELGFADVLLTSNPGQAKNVATDDIIVLNDGRTLPVKFRIETGIVGAISASVAPTSVRVNKNAAASAVVLDLHGLPRVGAGVLWTASGAPVTIGTAGTTTDGSGTASTAVTAGATEGTATITASSNGLSASADLSIEPAVVDQAFVLASMNDPRSGMAVAAHGGLLYAIGGNTYNVGTKATNEVYDPIANQWAFRTALPTPRIYASAAVVDGVIYVIGGSVGGCCGTVATVEAYDPATDSWTTKAPMLQPREQFGVAVHGGVIYAFGGWNPSTPFLTTVEAYDPSTNTWTPKPAMPGARAAHAAAAVGGKSYVVGGVIGATWQASVFEFDHSSETWAVVAPLPTLRWRLGAATVGGLLYAVAGAGPSDGGRTTIEAYDPATNTWSARSGLNIPRWALGVAALDGVVYAVGGTKEASDVPELEAYHP
jgi:N-acetylneuraminic acid mutarotase